MKPRELLEVSAKGLVPALKLDGYDPPRAVNESTVIMDYLDEYGFVIPRYIFHLQLLVFFSFFFFQPFSNEQAGSFTSPVQPMYAAL